MIVEARMLGKKKALVPEWSVPVPVAPSGEGEGGLTLRDVIERIVRAEVASFEKRQDSRRFVRVLSAAEIDSGRAKGKIESGGRDWQQSVDADAAVGSAWQAFEDGLYLVVLDGEEQRELDREVQVRDDSHVVFLRLTFLAGA